MSKKQTRTNSDYVSSDPDILVYKQMQDGSREAFNILFKKYYSVLCRFCYRIFPSGDVCEEIVQDVFIKIWKDRDETDIKVSVASLLYTMTRNLAINKLRKEKTRKAYETSIDIEDEHGGAGSVNEKKFAEVLTQSMAVLPEKCKLIFQLGKLEGLTYDEIADYLGVSTKTVENQMSIAFKKLKAALMPKRDELYT